MKRILIIDDEELIVRLMKDILEDLGHRVEGFTDPLKGEKSAIENNYDLILVDLHMPGKSGSDVIWEILKAKPEAKILLITSFPRDPLAESALNAGAVALMKKPFDIAKIITFLED